MRRLNNQTSSSEYFVYQDIIKVYPFTTCYAENDKYVYFDISIINIGEEVYKKRSPSFEIDSLSENTSPHKYDFLVDSIPIKNFYNQLTSETCEFQVICREQGTDIEQDRLKMLIYIDLEPKSLEIQSSPQGVNIGVDIPDQTESKDGPTPLIRQYAQGTSITLTAPATHTGWRFTEWQKNGQSFSTNSSIKIQVDDDATYKAVYQVLDSELYVSGSSSPEIFSLSGRPSQGWNNIRITVYNRKSTSIDVNVTKSGNAANWVKLIDCASFQLFCLCKFQWNNTGVLYHSIGINV